jgi:biotin carboxyl carrier protein
MQYEVEVNGRVRRVSVRRANGRFVVTLEDRDWTIDAARVDGQTLSLLIEGIRKRADVTAETGRRVTPRTGGAIVRSHEVAIAPDPAAGQLTVRVGMAAMEVSLNGRRRWGKKADAAHAAGGPQRIVAPMPGKIVRVLVKAGDSVRARQGLVVMEAMKMENELRASADGLVAELPVREGQSVDAGTLLAVVSRA